MPTHPKVPCNGSVYANVSAQEAVRRFLGRYRRIMLGTSIMLTVFLISTLSQAPSTEGVVIYAVACLCVLCVTVALNRRNFIRLMGILSVDCDAQKMLEAMSLLMEKRKRRRETPTYEVLYAMCSAQLGCDDIALQWVGKVEATPKLSLSNKLLACNVRMVVARHRDDWDALANARGRVVALCPSGRGFVVARRTADLIVTWIDFDLALKDKEWQRCNELLGSMQSLSTTRQQEVSMEHCRGMLAEAHGDMATARDRYAFVAENGGTCYMARQCSEWLAAHGR